MPNYLFKCESCGEIIEVVCSIYKEPVVPVCCGVPAVRYWITPAIHFKGKGWGKDKK